VAVEAIDMIAYGYSDLSARGGWGKVALLTDASVRPPPG